MATGAPRLPARQPLGLARGAGLAVILAVLSGQALAQSAVTGARYEAPTARYPHAVLGDDEEWGALVFELADGSERLLTLPEARVFEDIAPRLFDVDGDGAPEAVVVESDAALGARLAIYSPAGLLAATPFIGQRFRWLAPVGIGDLDGDGAVEIAYVDRPHLARVLRVWRFSDGALTEVASLEGVTNHRIGETDIAGGLRDCDGPEMIVASADWSRVLAVRLTGGRLVARDIGPHRGRESFRDAMGC